MVRIYLASTVKNTGFCRYGPKLSTGWLFVKLILLIKRPRLVCAIPRVEIIKFFSPDFLKLSWNHPGLLTKHSIRFPSVTSKRHPLAIISAPFQSPFSSVSLTNSFPTRLCPHHPPLLPSRQITDVRRWFCLST